MERGSFVEIDHTADMGLDLSGPSPAAILEAAQRGLIELLLGDISDLVSDAERGIEISAADHPTLLKAWCERLYRLLEDDGFVALATHVACADPTRFRAVIDGTRPSARRVAEAAELKAVTYHELAFGPGDPNQANSCRWHARVIFDV